MQINKIFLVAKSYLMPIFLDGLRKKLCDDNK